MKIRLCDGDEVAALSQSFFVAPHLTFTFVNLQLFCPLLGHTLFISPFLTSQITHTASFSSRLSFLAVFYVCRTSLWLPGGSFPPQHSPPPLLRHLPLQDFFRLEREGEGGWQRVTTPLQLLEFCNEWESKHFSKIRWYSSALLIMEWGHKCLTVNKSNTAPVSILYVSKRSSETHRTVLNLVQVPGS